jgi:hypothetical protein
MTLHEYVAAFCPDGPRQLRRLIRERTGVQLPYAYVWKWCNPERPCSLSLENATLVHTATAGQCSMEELQTLRKRLGVYGNDSSKRAKRRKKAARRTKPKLKPLTPEAKQRAVNSKLRKRVSELEQRLAALATTESALTDARAE